MMLDLVIHVLNGIAADQRIAAAADDGYVNPYRYDVDEFRKVDPGLIGYERIGAFRVDMDAAERLACDTDGSVWVAGGETLGRFRQNGELVSRHLAPGRITALSVQHPTGVWLGTGNAVIRYDGGANAFRTFATLGADALVTSVACDGKNVYVADAGQRTVHQFDMHAMPLGRIGDKDGRTGAPGFIIPSPYFDVRTAPDGTLWAANTGRRSMEHYTADGMLLGAWGASSFRLEGFCGCCNPAHFVRLPDGGFITAEKGLVRVKRYAPDGTLVSVVAPPADFDERTPYVDIALGRDGAVLVLDPLEKTVATYVRKKA